MFRFYRVNRGLETNESLIIQESAEVDFLSDWIPNTFFSLPISVSLKNHPLYEQGLIFGIDAASVMAVRALSVYPGSLCLDVCCAPGNKLCLISELAGVKGSVHGVDATEHRLYTCRSMLRKYQISNCKLFHDDGCTFQLPGSNACEVLIEKTSKRRKKLFEKSVQSSLDDSPRILYDRVLVDAECTHDASQRHIEKQKSKNLDESPWSGDVKMAELYELQRRLLKNGIENLKSQGILVYSTCSKSPKQNEEIVRWALTEFNGSICLDPLPFSLDRCKADKIQISDEIEACACFFDSEKTKTSGLFIARFKKL
jgi:16S rRNA C967 or C1407 C5-methylase (RsmB/RsmF family)